MTIRAPYGGGVHGALYHSQSVEAFFTHVPGLKVVIPSTPYDAEGLLRSAIRDDDPVLFFEHKKMYRSVRGDVPDDEYIVPLGKAAVTHPGTQITVVAYGLMAHYALEAADRRRGGGDQRRGRRPADAAAAGQGDGPGVGQEDRQVPRRLRGQPVRRLRRRGRGDRRRGGVRLPRRPGHRGSPGPDVPGVPYNHVLEDWFMVNPEKIADGDPQARRVLMLRRLEADAARPSSRRSCGRCSSRTRTRSTRPMIYGMEVLRRSGRRGARLVRRRAAGQAIR